METPDLTRAHWHTSTYSGGNGSCIEVARNLPGIVAVRDSKNPHGPKLIFTPDDGTGFASSIKTGRYSNARMFAARTQACPVSRLTTALACPLLPSGREHCAGDGLPVRLVFSDRMSLMAGLSRLGF